MSFVTQYAGVNTAAQLSPAIWHDCPIEQLMAGRTPGVFFDDHFVSAPDTGTITSATNIGPYEYFAESGGSITPSVTASNGRGAVNLVSGTTGDADVVLSLGGGAPFCISDTAGEDFKLWFEARLLISSVSDDGVQYFIGLTEEDRAAAAGIFSGSGSTTIGTAMSDIDYIGFVRLDGSTTGLGFAYNKAGASDQLVIAAAATLAAGTYVNVGFRYDPTAPAAKRISVFVNGSMLSTHVTATMIAASHFPDAEELTMTMGVAPDTTNSGTMTVDRWTCAQLAA